MYEQERTVGWTAYFDWAAELAKIDNPKSISGRQRLARQGIVLETHSDERPLELWEPIFVRSRRDISTEQFFATFRNGYKNGKGKRPISKGFAVDESEQVYNQRFRQEGEAVEAILYRKRGEPRDILDGIAEVVAVGGLTAFDGQTPKFKELPVRSHPADVAIGVIDDALPIYHANVRADQNQSRIEAVWGQSFTLSPTSTLGAVKSRADINADLAQLDLASEDELYARQAAELYHPVTRHALRRHATHGSLMLDHAAGIPPGAVDPLSKAPVFGVQLPPQAFDDTSGFRLQLPFLAAIRSCPSSGILEQMAT